MTHRTGNVALMDSSQRLEELTLEQLFAKAEQYGCVSVYGHSEKKTKYHVAIKFQTIPGVSLEAGSEFGMNLHDALVQATKRAQEIVKAYSTKGGTTL